MQSNFPEATTQNFKPRCSLTGGGYRGWFDLETFGIWSTGHWGVVVAYVGGSIVPVCKNLVSQSRKIYFLILSSNSIPKYAILIIMIKNK